MWSVIPVPRPLLGGMKQLFWVPQGFITAQCIIYKAEAWPLEQ